MNPKFLFYLTPVLLIPSILKAQSGYNYYRLALGLDISQTRAYTSVEHQNNDVAFGLTYTYNYSPYQPITAEVQVGRLSGGGPLDSLQRKYVNNYKAFIIRSDLQFGAFINYSNSSILNLVKNFYVGTGIGIISNSVAVQRIEISNPTYIFPGTDNSLSLIWPIRVGYEFKIFDDYDQPSFAIDIGYTWNFTFGQGLDGYDDPSSKFKNNPPDQYHQMAVGIKYFFGNVISYHKLIRRKKLLQTGK